MSHEKPKITTEQGDNPTSGADQQLADPGLPEKPAKYINDQNTFNSFKRGLAARAAVEAAMKAGRVNPDANDTASASTAVTAIFNNSPTDSSMFNAPALVGRLHELATAELEGDTIQIDVTAPIDRAPLEFSSGSEAMAFVAGMCAQGGMMISSDRKKYIESGGSFVPTDTIDLNGLSDVFDLIAHTEKISDPTKKKELLSRALSSIPNVDGLRDAIGRLAEKNAREFHDVDTVMNPISVLAKRAEAKGVSKARIDAAVLATIAAFENPGPVTAEDIQAKAVDAASSIIESSVPHPEQEGIASGDETIVDSEAPLEQETIPEEVEADNVETDDTPEEQLNKAFAEAIQSPDTLMAALQRPAETEGGSELKRELQKLVDVYKELKVAQKSEQVWQDVIAPELKKISRTDTETMVYSLRETHQFLESAVQGCDLLRRAVFNGYRDGISDAINRMPVRPRAIVERLSDGSYFARKAQYEDAVSRVGNIDYRALAEHEDVKKLSSRHQETSIGDMRELHALIMQAGGQPECIGAVKNRLMGEMPESDTWRRKLDTVQQIAQYARRISMSSLSEDVSGKVRVAINSLDYFVSGVSQGRYDGEAMNTATMKLDELADEFEGAQRLARLLQNMAEFA
jgi:hypothetical protein